MSKNKLAQSPRLKRNGNYRSNRRLFKIDNFLLSDILNTSRRTKVEEFPGTLFFNIKSLLPTEFSDNISVEQISFLIKVES
jgi:Mg2+ and Co2+ transporter CorA